MRRSVPRQVAPLHQVRAAAMRAAPTATEARLWEGLRGSQLGVGFRRQVPLGRYIVDFFAPAVGLAVEVDGGYHRGRAAADARRDRDLARLGVRVLRLPASLVAASPVRALALVRAALVGS